MRTKAASKTLSLFLVFCMVFTMVPTVVFADSGDVDSDVPLGMSSVITAFADLEDDIAEQKVDTGAPEEELKLLKELAVTVIEGGDTATGSDTAAETQTTVAVSNWTAEPEYNGETAGIYTFTPVLDLPESLTLAEGVTPHTITVTVEQEAFSPQARGAAGTVTGKLYMNGAEVVSDLGTDGGDLAANGWAWDAANATLTLNTGYSGGHINIGCAYGIDTVNLVFTESVSIDAPADESYPALSCQGHLNVSGSGILALTSPSFTLYVVGDLQITSGTVTATTTGEHASGIISQGGSITISGDANVTGEGPGTGDSRGIRAQNGPITISTTGTVTATGSRFGISANTTTIGSGTVELNGSQAKPDASIQTVITGGTVIYNGGTPPEITSIFPNSGVQAGGTSVVINGSGFASGATVKIGGTEAVDVAVTSASEITCTVPTGSVGTAHVLVETPGGVTALTDGFTYTEGGAVFFDAASSTFDLAHPPIGNWGGGSGATAWSWSHAEQKLTLAGVGPYTLTGTASGNMRVGANSAVDLTLDGASFTRTPNFTALYLSLGGTLRVTANSEVTGGINSGTRALEIILSNDALLQVIDNSGFSCLSTWGLGLSGSGRVTATSTTGLGVVCAGDLVVGAGCTLEATGGTGIIFQGNPTIRGSGNIIATGSTYSAISGNTITDSLTFLFNGDLTIDAAGYAVDMQKTADTTVHFTSVPGSLAIQSGSGILGASAGGRVALQNAANVSGLSEAVSSGATAFSGRFYSLAVQASAGGSITTGADGGTLREGDSFSVGASANSGYTFGGWSSSNGGFFANAASAATVFTMPAGATTLTARFTRTGSGSDDSDSGSGSDSGDSGGSSGGSGVVVTPPAPSAPNAPTQGSANIPGRVDGSGNVTANITNQTVSDAIDKALAQARQNGTEQNGIILTLNISTGGKPVNSLSANLPKAVQDAIIARGISNIIITAGGSDIAIGMDLAALREMNRQANGNVSLTATRMDNGTLPRNARGAIGNRPVFDLKANYGNGKQVQNFGAGSVSVTIPYSLGANENVGNIQAVYVDANGRVQWLISSVYDGLNGVLRFATSHFSTYGVGYKQDAPNFTDISTHWAKEDIAFVANRELLSGTSATTFSPNAAITRGMLVTALGRLANADVSGYANSSFTDVKSDAYYMGYIEWANKNNIVKGIGDGKFAPDQSITREQMAVILQSYAKAIGFTLPKVHAENTFADSAKIGAYAKDAVKQTQMAGIISGKSGNLFDPQGTATRAEVSAVLRRFVELAISSDTAQGWTMNDSGKWMYYENGKPVTGKKNISGSAYTFDQYGVTADVPKNLRYTSYTVQKNDSFWLIAHKLGCTMSELERLNNKSIFELIHPGDVLRVPER